MAIVALCGVVDCGKPQNIKGFCKRHYEQWRKTGDPIARIRVNPGQGICGIDGCGRIGKLTRGWCNKHYQRWQSTGDPKKSLLDREHAGEQCKIDGCIQSSLSKGLCPLHYNRLRRTGDPLIVSLRRPGYRKGLNWVEAHVHYDGDNCLIWPFPVNDHGRGIVRPNNAVGMSASRYMCILAHGAPPTDRHEAAHNCGKGHDGCVNPRHLRWTTKKDNERDKRMHGTLRKGHDVNTSKLIERDVRKIRQSGKSGVVLARMFGVTPSTIWSIRKRKTWAWLK